MDGLILQNSSWYFINKLTVLLKHLKQEKLLKMFLTRVVGLSDVVGLGAT